MVSGQSRAWCKPQLMAIVRMGTQEAVLTNCKTTNSGPAAITSVNVYSECSSSPGIGCVACNTLGSS